MASPGRLWVDETPLGLRQWKVVSEEGQDELLKEGYAPLGGHCLRRALLHEFADTISGFSIAAVHGPQAENGRCTAPLAGDTLLPRDARVKL